MVKELVKRYVAIYLSKDIKNETLTKIIEEDLMAYLGFLYPTKVAQVKYVKNVGKIRILSFMLRRGFDPHTLIPILSLIKANDCWIEPLLMSGTFRSLQESLKVRYPELAQG